MLLGVIIFMSGEVFLTERKSSYFTMDFVVVVDVVLFFQLT